ncbi:MAG: hypothetical protein DMD70_11185 [Gemmatimonadetes bacterium]|nr:MAG: hypothetical protein DMD70_11185 [Gemmatimonadota bacterium]
MGDRENGARRALGHNDSLLSGLHLKTPTTFAAAHSRRRLPDRDAFGAIRADGVAFTGKEGPAVGAGVCEFEVCERDDHAAAAHHQDRFVRCDAQYGVPRAAAQLAAPHLFA